MAISQTLLRAILRIVRISLWCVFAMVLKQFIYTYFINQFRGSLILHYFFAWIHVISGVFWGLFMSVYFQYYIQQYFDYIN